MQEALECLGAREAQQIAKELEGHVLEAATLPDLRGSVIWKKTRDFVYDPVYIGIRINNYKDPY